MKIKYLLFSLALVGLQACKEDPEPTSCDGNGGSTEFDRAPMLTNAANNIIIPSYQEFDTKVQNLETSFNIFKANVNQSNLDDLRIKWKEALVAWQYVGFFQFGPADGIVLKENMNMYPIDTIIINNNIAAGTYNLDATSNFKAKGLQALDFFLHGLGNTDTDIITFLTTDGNAAGRIQYMTDVIDDMVLKSAYVLNEWQPNGNDYAATFIAADGIDLGSGTNMLFNGLIEHFEKYVRSGKVGIPSGALTFSQSPAPHTVEAIYAGNVGKEMLDHGMTAFENIYNGIGNDGTDGEGFKEYLDYLGTSGPSSTLADDINSQVSAINTANNTNIQDPMSVTVVSNHAQFLDSFNEMQTLVTLVKNDLKNAIGLTITYSDSDGD